MNVAGYVRVSTDEQSLERQLTAVTEYAERTFGVEGHEVEIFRDKATGTDTDRDGYRDVMDAAENGLCDAVIVSSVDRVCRSNRDLERTVDRLKDAETELHIVAEGLRVRPGADDPFQKALLQLLGVFAELEANMIQARVQEGLAAKMESAEYHHGPPPLGFVKDDGKLYEKPNGPQRYEKVAEVLGMVKNGNLSKRKAAEELDSSRATINRSLEDRPELYGL